jgi:hypothetical protein
MEPWLFFSRLRHLVQFDIGGRGLDRQPGNNLFTACAGDLEAACRSIADVKRPQVAIVTGFYITQAEAYETDGPLGSFFLAEVLHQLGVGVTLLAEPACTSVLEVALRLSGLEVHINLEDLPSPANPISENWSTDFWNKHRQLTHLIAIERVGPTHTLTSLAAQTRNYPPPTGEFVTRVSPGSWNRPHNMRGFDLSPFAAPAHLLFEGKPKQVISIGIGDGGNEIGMGKIPWETIAANIATGDRIACRIATNHLIVAGNSNWGAYALAAGISFLRNQAEAGRLFNADREAQFWEAVLEKETLVDGVTGRKELTVDGQPWEEYRRPLTEMGNLLANAEFEMRKAE